MKMAVLMLRRTRCGQRSKWAMPAVPLLVLMLAVLFLAPHAHADQTLTAAVSASPADRPAAPEAEKPEPATSAAKPNVPPDKKADAKVAEPPATPEAELGEKWGISVLSTRLTAAGCMIDFRYRVLDPEKAAKLSDPHTHPYIIDEATGAKFIVPAPPKVGQLRNTRKPVANKNYFMLFANPSNYIKCGGKVSVVVGELKIAHLTVE